jgi:hypothetical protein
VKEMKKELNVNELWDELIERELFTYDELKLLTNINGFSIETLNDALYSRYGYRDYEQMMMYE